MPVPPLVWKPSPNFSERTARVDLLVLHRCEGGYQGTIDWFMKPESQVSAHYVVPIDCHEVTQMVDLAKKAWHVCSYNSRAIGVEPEGYSKDGFPEPLLTTCATIFAYLAHHLQIPIRHAVGGVGPGICSHHDLGAAGGGHNDPSIDPEFMPKFVAMVQSEFAKADYPDVWEPVNTGKVCALSPPGA